MYNNEIVDLQEIQQVAPQMKQAVEIGRFSKKYGFDWSEVNQVYKTFLSEVTELEEAWQMAESSLRRRNIEEELGDVFFSLSQLCRHLELDPDMILKKSNEKFCQRFFYYSTNS